MIRWLILQSFVLLIGVSPLNALAWHIPQALPFLLKIEGTNGRTSCTATLFKPAHNKCRLVTNAHCFELSVKSLMLERPDQRSIPGDNLNYFPITLSTKPESTELLKVNPAVDLAELAVPASLTPYCLVMGLLDQNHETEYNIDANRSDSHMSLGYHGGLPHVAHTLNRPWNGVRGYGKVTRTQTSLTGLRYLYRMTHIQMLAGMSGGLMLDEKFRLVGINRRYIPHQEVTDVIPLKDVIDFINSPSDGQVLTAVLAGKVRYSKDDGTSENGGENSGANGGENSGANGGGNQYDQTNDGVLNFLREPAEGIMIDGRRLLAIGPFQIDGHDDLELRKHSGLPYLFQDSAEFNNIRASLIERLAGTYRSHSLNGPSIKEKAFASIENGWREVLQGQTHGTLVIEGTSQAFSIKLRLEEYIATNVHAPWSKAHRMANSLVTFSGKRTGNHFKLISSSGYTLECKNQYFLKLICLHPKEELAISLTALQDGVLSFRHSQLHVTNVREGIIYRFGALLH